MKQTQTSAYRATEVLSLSKEDLILVLYQHLIINLKRGAQQIRAKNIEGKSESLTRASSIVYELLASLDFEIGGDLSSRLASLYAFWAKEISEAGREMNAARLESLMDLVKPLHESWQHAVKIAARTKPGNGAQRASEPAGGART